MELLKATYLSLLLSTATGALIGQRQVEPVGKWPSTYIAMGDSFAAGIGAGKFFDGERETKRCKRFAGSYPSQLRDKLKGIKTFDFAACSGDKLPDLDAQHSKLKGARADIVTLSISGNDFGFAKVVEMCLYNYGGSFWGASQDMKDKQCQDALGDARKLVNGNEVWDNYDKAVGKILSDRLSANPLSLLIITGYAKFFADQDGADLCGDKIRFMIPVLGNIQRYYAPLLLKANRDSINQLVGDVNTNIKSKIVDKHNKKVEFIDIDGQFNYHRFCDPALDNPVPAGNGKENKDVWFITFTTKLEEKEYIPRVPARRSIDPEPIPAKEDAEIMAAAADGDWTPPSELAKETVFHPKWEAHTQTALQIQALVDARAAGPPAVCENSDAGSIPARIWLPNLNGQGQSIEPKALLGKLREVVCGGKGNNCKMPSGIEEKYGAVASGENGKCEIAIGIKGESGKPSIEAYIQRNGWLETDDKVKHCWDTTQALIDNCVKNSNKKGYKNGIDPNPAFYELAYHKLGSFSFHYDVLPQPPAQFPDPGFNSVCNRTPKDFDCQTQKCYGDTWICEGGDFNGCKCSTNSRFGSRPGPTIGHQNDCNNDCCNSPENKELWWLKNWCPANCGGFSANAGCYNDHV